MTHSDARKIQPLGMPLTQSFDTGTKETPCLRNKESIELREQLGDATVGLQTETTKN